MHHQELYSSKTQPHHENGTTNQSVRLDPSLVLMSEKSYHNCKSNFIRNRARLKIVSGRMN